MVEADVPFPHPDADAIVANIAAALTPRTQLAVVDHITSGSALVLPLQRIVDACHAAGVPVLVDGAHGPAQVPLDMRALGADWYAGNCHKWLCAPKGSAFLYARAGPPGRPASGDDLARAGQGISSRSSTGPARAIRAPGWRPTWRSTSMRVSAARR